MTRRRRRRFFYVARWTLAGAILGVGLVLLGWRIGLVEAGRVSFADLHRVMPVMWLVDLSPTILGIAGTAIGVLYSRNRNAREMAEELAEEIAAAWIADLQRANAELVAGRETRDRFFAAVTHELRTPLTSILGYARLLEGLGVRPAEAHASVEEITSSASFLLEVVNDLLELARAEQPELRITIGTVDGSAVVADVVALLRPLADAKELNLHYRATPHHRCRADETRLRQILVNLVANAVKYTDHGTVAIRTAAAGDVFSVEVADQGCGMTPEQIERVFLPFERGDGGERRDSTGLGLALSRSLAEAMGGTLIARSGGPGQGTTFRLELPAAVGEGRVRKAVLRAPGRAGN